LHFATLKISSFSPHYSECAALVRLLSTLGDLCTRPSAAVAVRPDLPPLLLPVVHCLLAIDASHPLRCDIYGLMRGVFKLLATNDATLRSLVPVDALCKWIVTDSVRALIRTIGLLDRSLAKTAPQLEQQLLEKAMPQNLLLNAPFDGTGQQWKLPSSVSATSPVWATRTILQNCELLCKAVTELLSAFGLCNAANQVWILDSISPTLQRVFELTIDARLQAVCRCLNDYLTSCYDESSQAPTVPNE
jgi:hypothetical protein